MTHLDFHDVLHCEMNGELMNEVGQGVLDTEKFRRFVAHVLSFSLCAIFVFLCPGHHIQRWAFPGGPSIGKPAGVKRGHACDPCGWRPLRLRRLQQLLPSHGQDLVLLR